VTRLSRIAKEENPNAPFILLAHSMGSFAAQLYIQDHSREIDALILSGSGALDGLALLANSAPPGANILNAAFEPARTPFDWLSRDCAVVDERPVLLCTTSACGVCAVFVGCASTIRSGKLRKIRPDLPMYLSSGSEDPVGQQLEGVRVLMARYHEAGIASIAHDFYPGGRHEMLNEINREEVRVRLLAWIAAVLEGGAGLSEANSAA
jgi:alpha-beta hydrolase superfamily lysophospholipase